MNKKILITGGHLTPALAVIEQLQKDNWDIVYAGRKYALEGDAALSAEYAVITASNIQFQEIHTGRLQRTLTLHTLSSLFKISRGLWESFRIVNEVKPSVVLSFGGYVALPVAIASWLRGVPVVTHEQTMQPGLTNRIIATFAKHICVSWPDTAALFPAHKTTCTGNPLRSNLFIKNPPKLPVDARLPLVYITGGSLGSQSINTVVTQILPQLLDRFSIVHQCGNADGGRDYTQLSVIAKKLPKSKQDRYYVAPFIEPSHIGWILQHAALVIGRSGANTITELIAFGKPSILIPLPWSASGEQKKHAQFLASLGAAVLLSQKDLTPESLEKAIDEVLSNKMTYQQALKKITILDPTAAADNIISLLKTVVRS